MITFTFEGVPISVEPGTSVAAGLISHGERITRLTRVDSKPCSIFCGIGICFDCLIEIDGQPNQRCCITTVKEGMVVKVQHGS
jgi:predicted molibdopterin-dependent oxidoreductase YjgC